jgi:hypothetical protein
MVHWLTERLPCSHEARGGGFDRWQQEQPRLAADPSQSKMALERGLVRSPLKHSLRARHIPIYERSHERWSVSERAESSSQPSGLHFYRGRRCF